MAEKHEFFCIPDDQEQRLDAYLANKLEITRSQIKLLIDAGNVLVDGQTTKAGYRIRGTESITVIVPKTEEIYLEPEDLPLEIVYEDKLLMVINKPAGMVVYPGVDNPSGTLVNALLHYTKELSTLGGKERPGIVHRLDKDTSGLILIAKNDQTHQFLAEQLQKRTAKRHYLALVHGSLKEEVGIITAPIGRNPRERMKMAVVPEGRKAITHYQVRERIGNKFSLVECRLETGRTHQIRVHLASINHPIVGDLVYGKRQTALKCERQLLHAYYLGFEHPQTGWIDLEIGLPDDFKNVLLEIKEIS